MTSIGKISYQVKQVPGTFWHLLFLFIRGCKSSRFFPELPGQPRTENTCKAYMAFCSLYSAKSRIEAIGFHIIGMGEILTGKEIRENAQE